MKKIFLFLCAASMLFALSEAQIKDYIAQNSENIEQLQGTPTKNLRQLAAAFIYALRA